MYQNRKTVPLDIPSYCGHPYGLINVRIFAITAASVWKFAAKHRSDGSNHRNVFETDYINYLLPHNSFEIFLYSSKEAEVISMSRAVTCNRGYAYP
jgi:hypothetical protein